MKNLKLKLAFIFLIPFANIFAQSSLDTARIWPQNVEENLPEDTTVYSRVDVMPVFPGGNDNFKIFLAQNIKYPEQARIDSISGRVYISFVVTNKGKITRTRVLRGIGGGCDEEALRVVKMMPDWIPGKKGDKAVNVSVYQPVSFNLNDSSINPKKK